MNDKKEKRDVVCTCHWNQFEERNKSWTCPKHGRVKVILVDGPGKTQEEIEL
jgi:hypothetical protein